MKTKELSFTIDAAQMAALTNAALERDVFKAELHKAEDALRRKKEALAKYQKKVADQKAMLTHLQEICESRKAEELRPDGAEAAPSPGKEPCQKRFEWRRLVKIGYHLLRDDEARVYEAPYLSGGIAEAINRLNDNMGHCPLVIDWIEEEGK